MNFKRIFTKLHCRTAFWVMLASQLTLCSVKNSEAVEAGGKRAETSKSKTTPLNTLYVNSGLKAHTVTSN